jgi:hypothetical protein
MHLDCSYVTGVMVDESLFVAGTQVIKAQATQGTGGAWAINTFSSAADVHGIYLFIY